MSYWLLVLVLVAGVSGAVLLVEWRLERRAIARRREAARRDLLPPRYWNDAPVRNTPMSAADLVFDDTGAVAWNDVWGGFCDLALAGGPPHRETVLEPATPAEIEANQVQYAQVLDELERGLRMVTGWPVERVDEPGWIALVCPDSSAAAWLENAIRAERIGAERDGSWLFLPAGPFFSLKGEIKNVVTAVAKTHHYWTEHAVARGRLMRS